MKTGTCLAIILAICLGGSAATPAQTNSLTDQIASLRTFSEGLVWVGSQPPTEAENVALLSTLSQMPDASWTTGVEAFLQNYPQSAWAASLRHNYALFCRQSGRTTKALQQWELAWELVKQDSSAPGRKLAGSILANWMDQLASLGRLAKLQELIAAGDGMHFANNADRDKFQGAKNSFYLMQSHPGIAYRCGTFALKAVGGKLQPENPALESLAGLPSPTNGFSMATLVDLAKQYGLNLVAVRRTAGQELIAPSVVHWRQNHYAAILSRQGDSYLVSDPTFGHERWLTAAVINEEAGGEFLVPATALATNWTLLANSELESVHGMGLPNNINDAKDKGCQPGKPCPPCTGMPVAWVSEPYINLWMADEPISYLTSSGEPFTFRTSYKQRDTRTANQFLAVTGWNHSWLSYIEMQGTLQCLSNSPNCAANLETSYSTLYLPGGGTVTFSPHQPYDSETRLRLQPLGFSAVSSSGDSGINGLRLVHADGAQDIYSLGVVPYLNNYYPSSLFLRTRHIDADGQTTWFYYTYAPLTTPSAPVYLLSAVVDPDGRTNTLVYNSTNLLSEVDNPYGLKANFRYDANGNLTNITDAQGLSSSITYDTNNYPTALITPYGTTRFAINMNSILAPGGPQGNFGGHDLVDRAVQITDPMGATSLWLYRYDCSAGTNLVMPASFPSNEVPVGTPLGTLDSGATGGTNAGVCFRNSFYWGPRQYATLSSGNFSNFTASDYVRGRMRHWLADSDDLNLSGQVSVERAPSPDGTAEGLKVFYDYPGKLFPHRTGTNALPSVLAWRLPGGETHYQYQQFDYFGNVISDITTATLPDNTLGTRTNRFVYADNTYVYNYGGWNGTTLVNYQTIQTYTLPNLLTQIIGADGQTIWSFGGFDTVTWTNFYYLNLNNTPQTNAVTLTSLRVRPGLMTNGLGQTASATYSGGTPLQVYNPTTTNVNGQVGSAFSGYNKLTGFTSTSGLTITNAYYPNNFLAQVMSPQIGYTNFFGYTDNGLVGTFTNELGLNLGFTWDNLLRPTATQFPDGTTESTGYNRLDANHHQTRQGVQSIVYFDNAQRPYLSFLLDSDFSFLDERFLNWCGCGALSTVADAYTNTTTLNYDNAGRFTGYLFPDNSTVALQMDLAGRTTNVTDGAGRNLRPVYNHQGLVTNVFDAYNHSLRRVTYDLLDRPVVVTDANGVSFTNTFDALNRLLTRTWSDGVGEGYGYNAQGLAFYTNRNQQVTRYGHDAAGRLTAVTNANLEVNQFSYNPAGEITTLLDGLQHQTSWQYNQYGWLTNKQDGLGRTVFRYQYNLDGDVTNVWTPEKGNLAYTRDGLGRARTISYNGTLVKSFAYDYAQRLTNMVDAVGTTVFGYTPAGQLASEDGPWASDTVSYNFTNGLRTQLTIQTPGSSISTYYNYDLAGRLTNLTSTIASGFIYQYLDARPQMPAAIFLPNGATITNTFDGLARLQSTALKDHWGHTLDGYTYGVDSLGLKTNILRDLGLTNSLVKVGYDSINQITSWSASEGGVPRMNEQLGFAFDAANNLLRRTNNLLVQNFGNDAANQLNSLTRSGTFTLAGATPAPAASLTVNGQPAQTYGDFTFARTNLTLLNGTNSFTNIAANIYGALTTNIASVYLPSSLSIGYDSNGNFTNDGVRTMSYDAENQLTNVTVAGSFKKDFIYDGLNRLRIKREYGWISGNWTRTNEIRFVWDGNNIVQLRDSNNVPVLTLTRGLDLSGSLQGAGGIGGILAMTEGSGTNSYFHNDAGGNVTALMDASEEVVGRRMYDAFGKTIRLTGGKTGANTFWHASQLHDETLDMDAYLYRNLWHGPQRWGSVDPAGLAGGVNGYEFVDNDPLNVIDPLGLDNQFQMIKGNNAVPNIRLTLWPVLTAINHASGEVLSAPNAFAYSSPAYTEMVPTGEFMLTKDYLGTDPNVVIAGITAATMVSFAADEAIGMAAGLTYRGLCPAINSEIRFAQSGISSTFRNGDFAGQSIFDVASRLRSGAISPSQLPLNVVTRDGISYTLNNRSLMALRLGGVEPTVIKNVTGNAFFEGQLTQRLSEMGSSAGPSFIPIIRGVQ